MRARPREPSMSRKHDPRKDEPASPSDQASSAPAAEGAGPAAPEGLESLRAERDDLLARLQRVSADYLNYQKRVQRDIADAREFANAELIKSLLAVLDDMERALEAAKANHAADDPLLVGMQLVHDKAAGDAGAVRAVGHQGGRRTVRPLQAPRPAPRTQPTPIPRDVVLASFRKAMSSRAG